MVLLLQAHGLGAALRWQPQGRGPARYRLIEVAGAALSLSQENGHWSLRLSGDWSLRGLPAVEAGLAALPALAGPLICDWSQAQSPALAACWALLEGVERRAPAAIEVRHIGNPPRALTLLTALRGAGQGAAAAAPVAARPGPLGRIGRFAVAQGAALGAAAEFLGRIAAVLAQAFTRPRVLRLSAVMHHLQQAGVAALPIVALIAFLISVIIAYLGAQQLARFGAEVFVVDLVAISVLREMGVLLTAMIIAGRSGSAFAAEIGAMRLNEESDALRAMGLNPVELLVVPRMLALMLALPALTVVADAMGLAGGALLCATTLHIPPPEFIGRLREALAPTTVWAGLVKAPVFAALIAGMSTYCGMQVRGSARELGRQTTLAVVRSIFLVILADALFAVYFDRIDF